MWSKELVANIDPALQKWVRDSKTVPKKHRGNVAAAIRQAALGYVVEEVSAQEIDRRGVRVAKLAAFRRAVTSLLDRGHAVQRILVDGIDFYEDADLEHHRIKKGDSLYRGIAAASVLAKTRRDEVMEELHAQYPVYGWNTNAGYGTKAHRAAMQEHGVSPHHRMSYKPCSAYLR